MVIQLLIHRGYGSEGWKKKAPPEAGLRFEMSLPNRVGWHGLRTWVQIHSDLNKVPRVRAEEDRYSASALALDTVQPLFSSYAFMYISLAFSLSPTSA